MTIDVVGSKMPANNGYGQNGYTGPSSDLPGQHTCVAGGFGCVEAVSAAPGDWQTRVVKQDPYPFTHGMRRPSKPSEVVPPRNTRR